MIHDHGFAETDAEGVTLMTDHFDFAAPLGPLGRLAERLFLTRHMRRFLEERNALLRRCAEGDGWKHFLPDVHPTESDKPSN